jgi:hypothetical protein
VRGRQVNDSHPRKPVVYELRLEVGFRQLELGCEARDSVRGFFKGLALDVEPHIAAICAPQARRQSVLAQLEMEARSQPTGVDDHRDRTASEFLDQPVSVQPGAQVGHQPGQLLFRISRPALHNEIVRPG